MLTDRGGVRKDATSGFIWSLMERICSQGVATIISIILARILDPSHYGIIAIVAIFTSFCTTFVNSGFGTALIQKKDADELDFNSAFTFNLIVSFVLYLILFILAPTIASFYEIDRLTALLRVMGLSLPISALSAIQHAYMQKELEFKRYFSSTLISTLLSGAVGIGAALGGLGVWALALQSLIKPAVDSVVLIIIVRWKPRLRMSYSRIKTLIPFGSRVLITTFIMNLESEIRSLIIGKQYSATDLAFYNNGAIYPKLIFMNIGNSITRVMLPLFSSIQDDEKKFRNVLSRSIKVSTYAIMPLLAGLIAVAKPMVIALYTDKWIASVPFIQIICLAYFTQSYENSCKEALLATGRSGLVMRNMFITKIVSLVSILIAVYYFRNIYAIAWSGVLWTIISVALYANQISKFFQYSVSKQLFDVLPAILLSVLMGCAVYTVPYWLHLSSGLILIVQILLGAIIYIGTSWIFKVESFVYLLSYVKDYKEKIRAKL